MAPIMISTTTAAKSTPIMRTRKGDSPEIISDDELATFATKLSGKMIKLSILRGVSANAPPYDRLTLEANPVKRESQKTRHQSQTISQAKV